MEIDNRVDKLDSRISSLENSINNIQESLTRLIGKLDTPSSDSTPSHTISNKSQMDIRYEWLSPLMRKKVDSIMKNFDFKKVHDVMKLLDWHWLGAKNGVPTEDEMKTQARKLVVDSAYEHITIATGGFRAVYEDIGDGDPYLGLEFIVTECEGFSEDDDEDDEDVV